MWRAPGLASNKRNVSVVHRTPSPSCLLSFHPPTLPLGKAGRDSHSSFRTRMLKPEEVMELVGRSERDITEQLWVVTGKNPAIEKDTYLLEPQISLFLNDMVGVLQYSCLGNPMDRGVWWATVHGVAKSQTQLSTHTHPVTGMLLVSGQPTLISWEWTFALLD